MIRLVAAGLLKESTKGSFLTVVGGGRCQATTFGFSPLGDCLSLVFFLGYLRPISIRQTIASMEREDERESNKADKKARAIVLGGRKELMEQQEEELSSSSFSSMRQCRICHEDEDERCAAMEYPCACSGSLKYAHRECVQRWCDEKGSTLCEICLQNFESGYTIPPKKTPVVETVITVSEDVPEVQNEDQNIRSAGSEGPIDGPDYAECSSADDRSASWCRSLTITFTIILLVWHLIAVKTIEAADHCAFSRLTIYLLRAAGILLPFYAVMRLIRMIQHGQRQYRLQRLQEQRRRNASNLHSMHGQEERQRQLVISVH